MGLFTKLNDSKSKKSKSTDVNPTREGKRKKEKKSLFGGKKKELTLLERMQLEESVAAASLDVVQEIAGLGNSAVRELDEGLLIIAITNEMLEEIGLDSDSEEFGSFAEALRSETVESITLANDLAAGVIGIIPSQETLISLDEFEFVHDLAFYWALVPFDLGDDDRLTVLNSTVHIDRLVEMANNRNIQLGIKNGEVIQVFDDEEDGLQETYTEPEGVENEEETVAEFDEEESLEEGELDAGGVHESEDSYSVDYSDNSSMDFDDAMDELPEDDYSEESDDGFGEEDYQSYDHDDSDFDMEDMGDMEPGTDEFPEDGGMTADENKEAINRVIHAFNNTELDLHIDLSKFDDYFNSVPIAQFDTTRTDNSELQNVLSKMRQDANIELQRLHQDNIQSLRNKYMTSMRDIHNKLVESLDHKDKDTTYGQRHYEIEADYEEAMDDLERRVADKIDQINKEYHQSREEYAENAKREALAVYDSRYRDERNRKIESVKDNVQTDLKTNRDTELGELYKDRKTVALRLFDKATTALLQLLQEEYQAITQKELQMYDAFRKSMDAYLRKHYADEVLRAKAEAEKLKQSHEAERVRAEYNQMLMTKARQLNEADEKARDNLRQLEVTHKEQLDHVKKDYERRIERERQENQNLRELLQNANESNTKIIEQKEEEVKHRMNMYEDAIVAKDKQLEYANQRAEKAHKPMKGLMVSAAAIALALGLLFGFLLGTNSVEIAPGSHEAEALSLQNEASTEVVWVIDAHTVA
jgi:hypothetical protein